MHKTLKHLDIIATLEVVTGNPNGDPDNQGSPRVAEDGYGKISPQAQTRVIRNAVLADHKKATGYEIQIEKSWGSIEQTILSTIEQDEGMSAKLAEKAEENAARAEESGKKKPKKPAKTRMNVDNREMLEQQLRSRFFDVRMFGAVNEVGSAPAANTVGAVSTFWGTSLCPVSVVESTVTRCLTANNAQRTTSIGKEREMGKSFHIEHAVYKLTSKFDFQRALFNAGDVPNAEQLIMADVGAYLLGMARGWTDASTTWRGQLGLRDLWVVAHKHERRDVPLHKVFDALKHTTGEGYKRYEDYQICYDVEGVKPARVFSLEQILKDPTCVFEDEGV